MCDELAGHLGSKDARPAGADALAPEVAVLADASAQTRFLALVGRTG